MRDSPLAKAIALALAFLLLICCPSSTLQASDTVELTDGWHQGPLPAATFFWGGIVLKGVDPARGFHFADFHGDHVMVMAQDGSLSKRIEADEIGYWNNSIRLPVIKPKKAANDPQWMRGFMSPFKIVSDPKLRLTDGREAIYDEDTNAYWVKDGARMRPVYQSEIQLIVDEKPTLAPPLVKAGAKGPGGLHRAGLRSLLRLKALRAKGEEKEALQQVLSNDELFESVYEGLSTEHAKMAGGKLDDLLTWVKNNWPTILQMIITLVTVFGEEQQAVLTDGPPPLFVLTSYPLYDRSRTSETCKIDAASCNCSDTCRCRTSRRHCLGTRLSRRLHHQHPLRVSAARPRGCRC